MGEDAAPTAGEIAHPPRALCLDCLRPKSVCYCAHVVPIETRTRVLILQHPRERKVGVNTAGLAHQSLPHSMLRVGLAFDQDEVVQDWIHDPDRPAALLFPGDGAVDVVAHPPTGPVTLVVVDGTWWQAGKLVRTNPTLAALPRYGLSPQQPSRYRIRAEPAGHCVSTIEALAQVLGVLEGNPERMAAILAPFDRMVEAQLEFTRQSAGLTSRHAHMREHGGLRTWQWLTHSPERVILAVGETNEWPRNAREGLPEIVHWVAVRPASGARFEAVVRPGNRLAPSCPIQLGMPREVLEAGMSFPEFRERWAQFAGQGDLVCTWGRHAGDAAARDGLQLEPRLDLRAFVIKHLRRRAGEMESYAEALGAHPAVPWAQGRAGARLAALEAIAKGLALRLGGRKP